MKRKHFLIIIAIFLFYAINNYLWLLREYLPAIKDEAVHLWTSLRFVNAVSSPSYCPFYELLHANTTHWPPLFHFTASLFNIIFGTSQVVSIMANMPFFLLLLISVYLIGKKMHSPAAGISAVVIISLYPIIYEHLRFFLLDLPLTSMVSFSVYCLLSSEYFSNRKWSIIFGISVGLGMLTKLTYILFIAPLFIYNSFLCFVRYRKEGYFRRILLVIAISTIVGLLWYFMNMELLGKAYSYLAKISLKRYRFDVLRSMPLWLLLTFNNNMLSFLFSVLLIVSSVIFYSKKDQGFKSFITIWWLIPIVLVGSLVYYRQARFFMPVLPCFAIVSAIGIEYISNRKVKNALCIFIVLIGLMQYYSLVGSRTQMGRIGRGQYAGLNIASKPFLEHMEGIYNAMRLDSSPAYDTDWRHRAIAESFASHVEKVKNFPFLIGIIVDTKKDRVKEVKFANLFGSRTMDYYLIKELIGRQVRLGPDITLKIEQDFWRGKRIKDIKFFDRISDMVGLLYISEEKTWPTSKDLEELRGIFLEKGKGMLEPRLLDLIDSREKFRLIDRIKLPYDYYANLYLYKMPEIKKEGLLVTCFEGKIKIFYKDKELTKDAGISSCIEYDSISYKYRDAIHAFYNISSEEIKIVSNWLDIGVTQSTFITVSSGKINIKARLETLNDIALDAWYMNSLISDEYREWLRPFSKGVFKKISMFSDPYKFEALDIGYNGTDDIGIKGEPEKFLPALLFRFFGTDISFGSGVSNTNYYHNARCVYVGSDSKIELKSGTEKYVLDAEISILDNRGLEKIIADLETGLQ